jgi:NAD(P)-dependent dehydrogenase (short-subunit alcohol dehydrogenase family)
MNVVVTGSSSGMGREIALKFLMNGHTVYGLDVQSSCIKSDSYHHHICDVSDKDSLPDIDEVNILINNAGVQHTDRDIEVNLKGVIYCTEKYGLQPAISAIINQASNSASNGSEFPEYVASKGGVKAYTIWTAKEVAKYGAICNSLSFGGVVTPVNNPVMTDAEAWDKIMMMTPLRKWATEKEAAEWAYFLSVVNRSCTGQDIIIDNGEFYSHQFIWE